MIHYFPRTGKRAKALNGITSALGKKLEKHKREISVSLMTSSMFSKPRSYVPSGLLPFDIVVSRKGQGIPTPVIMEIFGPNASLKTAILEAIIAEAQQRGYFTMIWPVESSIDQDRLIGVGVDPDQLLIGEGETFEDIFEELQASVLAIRAKDAETPIVIGWDSVAATSARSEMEHKDGIEGGDMGKAGLLMSRFFRRLKKFLYRNKVALICINQTRANLGQMYGPKETTPGGVALKFYSWIRCRTRIVKQLKDAEGVVEGMHIQVECVKNKLSPPFRSCTLPIYWNGGINKEEAVWMCAVDMGLFEKKGTTYRYNGQVITKNVFINKFYHKHKHEIDNALRRLSNGG